MKANLDRRQFLRGVGRCAAGAGVVAGLGLLVLREGQACEVVSPCQRCGKFDEGCDLEKAKLARRDGDE
jgi:hypothetical protein